MTIRRATVADVPVVLDMIRELADYEREPHAVAASVDDLRRALFDPEPAVWCHVATDDEATDDEATDDEATDDEATDGTPTGPVTAPVVGFALWFTTFSTWTGRHGIYLEDLYVRPDHRRAGHGRALLLGLAGLCAQREYARLEWSVLDWNTPAQRFYRGLGAVPVDGWTRWRLDSAAISALVPADLSRDDVDGEGGGTRMSDLNDAPVH